MGRFQSPDEDMGQPAWVVLAKVCISGYFACMKIPALPKIPASLPSIHSIDLTSFDVKKLDVSKLLSAPAFTAVPKLIDASKQTVSKLNVANLPLPNVDVTKIASAPVVQRAKDAGYTAVGFGVLTFQKAQVRRRELTETITSTLKQTVKDRFNTAK